MPEEEEENLELFDEEELKKVRTKKKEDADKAPPLGGSTQYKVPWIILNYPCWQ